LRLQFILDVRRQRFEFRLEFVSESDGPCHRVRMG
jgi:hypothetical protein